MSTAGNNLSPSNGDPAVLTGSCASEANEFILFESDISGDY